MLILKGGSDFVPAREAFEKTARLGQSCPEDEIYARTERERDGARVARSGNTQFRCAKLAEDKHVVEQDVAQVHRDQRGHIDA